jgi:hypothetical protein
MKKWVALFFVCIYANSFSQTNISPQFSELKGIEDQQVKSNLLQVEILNLYPLSIGNRWVYLTITFINPNIMYGVKAEEVIGDTIAANGKLYYHLKEDDYHYLDRIDSVYGKVYRYYEHPNLPESEYVIFDLLGEVGDTLITFIPTFPGWPSYLIITSIDTFYKWGLTKVRKNFVQTTYLAYSHFSYTEDIGMDYWGGGINGTSSYFEQTLKGCLINGIVYGDTTLTDVGNEEAPIATSFKLEQNYPNPFNPTTKIKFTIPGKTEYYSVPQIITLKVYDVLGNEVTTLVNEELTAGEYEVEFNAQSLTSGIYFYQLKSGSFVQTKKMVLLK